MRHDGETERNSKSVCSLKTKVFGPELGGFSKEQSFFEFLMVSLSPDWVACAPVSSLRGVIPQGESLLTVVACS